jgi:hypothetical protein
MRRLIVLSLLVCAMAWAMAPAPAQADTCKSPGKSCLFVDSSGCAISCDGRCWVTTGGCSFGFGYDAICRCHDKKDGCKTACQEKLGKSVGQFGQAVSTALTNCELQAEAAGQPGGGCFFDPTAREAVAAARRQAMAEIHSACTDADVFDCFGIATVDDLAGRLLKNAESAANGANLTIFDDGPIGESIDLPF